MKETPMNSNDKKDFQAVLKTTGVLYDKQMQPERIKIYWEALKHLELGDIKTAINQHVQDKDRGRFFPLPADISAQLPDSLWPGANEAWALCPKDEYSSAGTCSEILAALSIAQPLIDDGDMVAARMAFIEHYRHLVEQAEREGRIPRWFASYGFNKETRYLADKQVVELQNRALPHSQKIPLPDESMTNERLGIATDTNKEEVHEVLQALTHKLKGENNEQEKEKTAEEENQKEQAS